MLLNDLKESDKSNAVQTVIESSAPNREFYIMISLSVCLATLGWLLRNETVVIGSMLIAPLLHPFLSASLGIATLDGSLILRSIEIIIKSVLISVLVSMVTTSIFLPFVESSPNDFVLQTITPSGLQFMVGVIAGAAASFAIAKETLAAAIPGVAISVALIPPLAAIGVGLAELDQFLFMQASLLFIFNILGIVFSASLVFVALDFKTQEKRIDKSLEKEEKQLAKNN